MFFEKTMSFFEKNIFKLFAATVVFILLYPKFPLINVSGTYVAIRIEDFLISFLVGIWFLVNIKNIRSFLSKNITKPFLLFWLIGFLSLLSGLFLTYSVHFNLGFLHWLRRVEMMLLFFVAATSIKNGSQVKAFLSVMVVVNLIILIYGFGQIFLDFPVISTTNQEFAKGLILKLSPDARANSTFAGHYDLAAYLSVALVFFGSMFFYLKEKIKKTVIAISSFLSFILLGMTAARVSFVMTFFALTVVFWMVGKRLLIGVLISLAIFAVAVIPELRHRLVATITVNLMEGGGAKYSPPPNKTTIFTPQNNADQASFEAITKQSLKESTSANRVSTLSADIAAGEPINTTELGVYRSFNIRTDVEWPRAIRALAKNPVFGTGYSSISLATDNDILRSLGETGLLGTLSLFVIFFGLIKKFMGALKKSEIFEKFFLTASLCSVLVIGATGFFIDVLEASKIAALFWVMLGVSWAVAGKYKYDD